MSALAFGETREGATLKVRVAPGARREALVAVYGDALKVSVQAPPEKGRANDAVTRLLAAAVGAAPADVTVVRGATSRDKVVAFRGWDAATLEQKIQPVLVTLGRT